MKRYYMKCGHIVVIPSYAGKRVTHQVHCDRCGVSEIEFKIRGVYDRLEGRQARCGEKVVKSRWDLPGFMYQPGEDYDEYFWGNSRRVLKSGRVKVPYIIDE